MKPHMETVAQNFKTEKNVCIQLLILDFMCVC
jgi:hypothetical protein